MLDNKVGAAYKILHNADYYGPLEFIFQVHDILRPDPLLISNAPLGERFQKAYKIIIEIIKSAKVGGIVTSKIPEESRIIGLQIVPNDGLDPLSVEQAKLQTQEVRDTLFKAGLVNTTPEKLDEFGSKLNLVKKLTPQEIDSGIDLARFGINGNDLREAGAKAAFLNAQEISSVENIATILDVVYESDEALLKRISLAAEKPTITFVDYSTTPPPTEGRFNNVFFESTDNGLSPIVGIGEDFAKNKAQGFIEDAFKKGAEKVAKKTLQKGAEAAVTKAAETGVAAVTKAAAGGVGATAGGAAATGATVAGGTVAVGVSLAGAAASAGITLVIEAAILLAKKVIQKIVEGFKRLYRILSGDEDPEKLILAGSSILFVGGIGFAIPALIILGGLGLIGSSMAILGGVTIARGVVGFGQTLYLAFAAAITGSTILAVILSFIGMLVFFAFAVYIIFTNSYVVPPNPVRTTPYVVDNEYIKLEKEATPNKFDNPPPSRTANYSIKITAIQGSLIVNSITYECKVVGLSAGRPCPPNPTLPTTPFVVPAGPPYEINYSVTYDSNYRDSIITDTVTVVADAPSAPGQTVSTSASVIIGNPPIDCPLITYNRNSPSGVFYGSYTPGNETQGHGSNRYWGTSGACAWSLPQSIGCYGPTSPQASSNVCYSQGSKCAQYGYAFDVFASPYGSVPEVFAPRVVGTSVTWNCSYAFANGGGSVGHTYRCSSGQYLLILTHMANGARTGTIRSGEKIGNLFNQSQATHLHLEFALGGVYQRPEDYFCK